ncbi:phosphotransferase family protein [Natronosalvus vescus]|uniref:phosphotransferase family protein n=1 Tax=Natronosalvus vescus TaxID=2953881 RepID=UPI00209067A1|nr:aminoglycoside phosphotransferase family protein [Natronosalvus vescus]
MDDVPEARTLSRSDLEAIVRSIEPTWTVREARPAERGFCSVYRVETANGETVDGETTRTLYVKASPDGRPWAIPSEARLQAVLATHTSIPVPEVVGVVDDHETLPTPAYLMHALPGEDVAYERVGRLDDDALGRLARETGQYLAELHSVPAVDAFGHVRYDGPQLRGEQPDGDPATLTVGEPRAAWSTYFQERVDRALERHVDSGLSALTPDLARWFEAGVEALEGPFDPVLGRNDHGLHNLLIDPDTGEITAVLDWGYTLAVPAAYDFEFAVYLYSGAFLAGVPDVPDRRSLVREEMRAGYRSVAPDRAEAVSTPRPLYAAMAMVRIMNDFHHLDVPEDAEKTVREYIRADVRTLLERSPADCI